MTKRQMHDTLTTEGDAAAVLAKAVRTESRICFGLAWFDDAQLAEEAAQAIMARGDRYNGGYYHGMPCGRAPTFDYFDPDTGRRLYAVTTR